MGILGEKQKKTPNGWTFGVCSASSRLQQSPLLRFLLGVRGPFLGKKGPRRTPLIPKKPPNGWTFCAFAPLPGCVWSSPFCPPAEVSGREVVGRGSGRGKSTQLPGCDQIPFLRFLERVRENFLARSFPAQPHSFQKSPRRMAGAVLFDSVYFPMHRVRR